VLDFYSTNSLSWDQLEYNTDELQNLHYGLIHVGLPTAVDMNESILPNIKKEFLPKNYELCKNGDVAFADASEDTNEVAKAIEFVNLSNRNVVCGLHTIHGRDNHNLTSVGFKGYAFASESFHNQIRRIAQGTKIFSISCKNFTECYIGIPSKEEQTKIAKLLGLIDERISTQIRIIEDLKQLRSALIENMYSHMPTKCKVGDAIMQVSMRNRDNTYCTVLSVNNRRKFIEQSEQFEDRIVASDDTSNYKVVKRNDFAYNPARINVGSIARLTTFEDGIVSPMYICFQAKQQILPEYLEYFFYTRYFHNEMLKRLEGSVRMCLSWDSLCNIPLTIPNIEQQRVVSRRISILTDKIIIEEKYKEYLMIQKHYLLKAMFI